MSGLLLSQCMRGWGQERGDTYSRNGFSQADFDFMWDSQKQTRSRQCWRSGTVSLCLFTIKTKPRRHSVLRSCTHLLPLLFLVPPPLARCTHSSAVECSIVIYMYKQHHLYVQTTSFMCTNNIIYMYKQPHLYVQTTSFICTNNINHMYKCHRTSSWLGRERESLLYDGRRVLSSCSWVIHMYKQHDL